MKERGGGDEVEKEEQQEVATPTDESLGDEHTHTHTHTHTQNTQRDTKVQTDDENLANLVKELNVLETQEAQGASTSENESFSNPNPSPSQKKMSLEEIELIKDPKERKKAMRKYEKKRKKQERRAQREGRGDPTVGQKQCDMCGELVDLLIRCQYDESQQWKMVCGGGCWKKVSGGVVDGDVNHPYYKYGGLWKNRRRK